MKITILHDQNSTIAMQNVPDYIILNEHSGGYITRINWERDGSADIHTTNNLEHATTYTKFEAESLTDELGRGFIIEKIAK
jgi:hypothetical protein